MESFLKLLPVLGVTLALTGCSVPTAGYWATPSSIPYDTFDNSFAAGFEAGWYREEQRRREREARLEEARRLETWRQVEIMRQRSERMDAAAKAREDCRAEHRRIVDASNREWQAYHRGNKQGSPPPYPPLLSNMC